MISARQFYTALTAFGTMPSGNAASEWLSNAERDMREGFKSTEHELTIPYASFRNLWIFSVFVPATNLKNPNKNELYNAYINATHSWYSQRSWGGGQGHRMFL